MTSENTSDAEKPVPPKSGTDDPRIAMQARVAKVAHEWRDEFLKNSAFSRDTGAWNALYEAFPTLIERIVEEVL